MYLVPETANKRASPPLGLPPESAMAICTICSALGGIRQTIPLHSIVLGAVPAHPNWPFPTIEVQPFPQAHWPLGRARHQHSMKGGRLGLPCSLDLAGLWAVDCPAMSLWQVVGA